MSFRFKLFVFSALIGIIPVLIIGWFWFSGVKENLYRKTFEELTAINQLSSDLLREWTNGSISLLESLAQRPLVIANIQAFLNFDAELPVIQKELEDNHFGPALKMYGDIKILSIFDVSGKLIVSTDHHLIGQIRENDKYILEGRTHSYVGNVAYSASTGEAVVHVSTPVKNGQGETIAILVGHLNWNRASQLLALIANQSNSLESYLVNRYHFMLTDSRFIVAAPLRMVVATEGFQHSLESGTGQGIYTNYRGGQVIGAYRWLPNIDASLLTEMNIDELNIPLRKLKVKLYAIIIAIIVMAVIMAFFLSRILSRPITSLISGVKELTQGKLDYRFVEIDKDMGTVKIALNKMAEHLQETIETRDTINRQLIGANKELEAFAYSVSHDLRAPLRAIDGFSNALAEDYKDRLDEKAQKYLDYLRKGAQEMGGLIDDLLTLSRSTRGEIACQTVDISGIAQKISNRLKETDPSRPAEIHIEPNIHAWCDKQLIGIVLENLLGNAWKYTSKKEMTRISLTLHQQDATLIEVCIQDNGAGFDNEYADKLFEPFQRLHRKDEFPGSGIGLSTVQRILYRLGGAIRGEGLVGEGACFYMTLQKKEVAYD